MKMETAVYSPRDGVVQDVHVQAGTTVDAKDLLVTLAAV
jgi:pyruvate carboxylase